MAYFKNRVDAGRQLADRLEKYHDRPDVLVLGLPRGGVPVAWEVARRLNLPMDIFLVRKLGVPGHEELAMGAIASGGMQVINDQVVRQLAIPFQVIDAVVQLEKHELKRREQVYRDDRPFPDVTGKTVMLVDDGLATGASMMAAVRALRQHRPVAIVVGAPTAALDVCQSFKGIVDEIVCLITPEPFIGVGMWYEDFSQVTDQEVRDLLEQAEERELRS